MKTLFADTNIFLRFLLNDMPAQYKTARQFFQEAKEEKCKIIICQPIIFEIDFALTKYYKFDKAKVVDNLGTIVGIPYLEIEDREVFQDAFPLYAKNNLDLVDCFLVVKARQEGGEVLSFDKKIKKAR